jgi:amidase
MARTVAEAAALLTVLAGDGTDYAAHAGPGRLSGRRIGVPRAPYWGYSPHADAAAESAVALLAAEGATIVDDLALPFEETLWADELVVLLAELREGLGDYLATRRGDVPRSLEDVVRFNREHADRELAHFGQSLFEQALAGPTVLDREYAEARARGHAATREHGIDRLLAEHELDALVTPSYAPASPIDLVNPESFPGSCSSPTAIAGYPLLTVPTELRAGLPVAISFWGAAGSEATLIELGAGYEAARDRTSGPLPPPGFATFV